MPKRLDNTKPESMDCPPKKRIRVHHLNHGDLGAEAAAPAAPGPLLFALHAAQFNPLCFPCPGAQAD